MFTSAVYHHNRVNVALLKAPLVREGMSVLATILVSHYKWGLRSRIQIKLRIDIKRHMLALNQRAKYQNINARVCAKVRQWGPTENVV